MMTNNAAPHPSTGTTLHNASSSSSSSSSSAASTTPNTQHTSTVTTHPTHSYKVEDNEYTHGGYYNRILLALKSKLPNEIDWALAKLCSISYTNDRFHLQSIPGLLDALMDICLTFAEQCVSDLDDLLLSKDDLVQQTRSTLILHALRNFSFVQTNFRYLTSARAFLLTMLMLPNLGKTAEVKLMALDILENVAFMLKLEPTAHDVALLQHLHTLVLHPDRAFVLGSLRTLCRLALLEANETMLNAHLDLHVVTHVCQWLPLLLHDEELVHRALDYLYQFTLMSQSLTDQIASALTSSHMHMILHCVGYKLLSSRALEPGDPKTYMHLRLQPWLAKPASAGMTAEMQKKYLWVQKWVEPDPQASLSQTALQLRFDTHPDPAPNMTLPAFLELVQQVCPVQFVQDQVLGFHLKHSVDTFACTWAGCQATFPTLPALRDHALAQHGRAGARCEWARGTCQWPCAETHLASHFPRHALAEPVPVYHHIHLETTTDPVGVPYTACLVLRNLARAANSATLFAPIYDDLVLACSKYPRLTKYLMWPLSELKFHRGE